MIRSIIENKDLELATEIYQSAEQIAGIGSYNIRLETGEMMCSPNLRYLFGHEPLLGPCTITDFLSTVVDEDKAAVQQCFDKLQADHLPFEIEFRAMRNGELRVFYQKCKVFAKRDGVLSIVGIVQDITERKQAVQAMEEQAHFINKVVATAPDLISVINLTEGKLEYINHENPEIYGYSAEEMMDMDPAKRRALIHPDDIHAVRAYFAGLATETSETAHLLEYRAMDKNGCMQWFRSRGKVFKRDSSGKPTHCLNVIHNISDRKQVEADLQKSEAFLKEAEHIGHMGSWGFTIKTGELIWSDELYRLFGIEPSNIPVSSESYFLEHVVHPEDREVVATYLKSLGEGNTAPVEYRILRPDSEERWVYVKAKMEYDENGSLEYIRGISSDITQQKRAEHELRNLNKALVRKNRDLQNLNAELAGFANLTGHDLKEPLRKVYSFLELIANKENDRLSEAGRGNVKRAQAALQRMNLLTDDILAFTEISTQNETKSKIDLNQVVVSATNRLRDKIARSGAVIENYKLPVIKGYRMLLLNLLYYLVDNAIKFHIDGNPPHIRITGETVKGNEIPAADAIGDTSYVKLVFSDNGLGLASQANEEVFNVFSQSSGREKMRGGGVGLAICKKVVDRHHGFITVESKESSGTAFTIYLPA